MSAGPPAPQAPPPASAQAPIGEPLRGAFPGSRLTPPPWGWQQVLIGIVVLVGCVLLSATVAALIVGDGRGAPALAISQALFGAAVIIAAIVTARLPGTGPGGTSPGLAQTFRDLGFRRPEGRPIADALAAIGFYLLCSVILTALIAPQQEDLAGDLGARQGTLLTIVAGVLIVLVAPLSEEMFFRGVAFSGLRRGLPFAGAVVISSGAWAALHLATGDIAVVVQLFILGIALSALYERTNSIWPPLAIHVVNNAAAFAILTFA